MPSGSAKTTTGRLFAISDLHVSRKENRAALEAFGADHVVLATGSSWTTVATVGIALLGIGKALGLSEPMIAGAIVSGAYFGDKISPLSDTTNLASAMAGCDLFTHVRYMLWTTTPSILLTIGIFWYLGSQVDVSQLSADTETLPKLIAEHFNITTRSYCPVFIIDIAFDATNDIKRWTFNVS